MALPNFLIVGAAKSGTTSLTHYLSQHPDIFISPLKDRGFFTFHDNEGIKYYKRVFFNDWANQKAIGEADVAYLTRSYCAEKIYHNLGLIRILIILRNPVERAFSDYLMGYNAGRFDSDFYSILLKNKKDLEKYEELKLLSGHHDDLCEIYEKVGWTSEILQIGHYYNNINEFEHYFGKDNLFICFFEELKDIPNLLKRIYKFLDVDDKYQIKDHSIRNSYQPSINRFFHDILGKDLTLTIRSFIPRILKEYIKKKIPMNSVKPTLGLKEKKWLIEYYRPQNSKLAAYLNKDLSHWNS